MSASDLSNYIQANVNGQLLDARQPAISPLDRGFLYGDAIYEVCRSYGGVLFAFDEHWRRLEGTAEGLALKLPFGPDEAFAEIRKTVAAWREATGSSGDVYARLQISRGCGLIGLDTAFASEPNYAIYVKAQPDLSQDALDKGLSLSVPKKWRRNPIEALSPALKTGNYLNNILGLSEARLAGADDALFLNLQGRATEASTRNVWFVFTDRIATPPTSEGLLFGVTRAILLESIRECEGLPLVEEALPPERYELARECFLSSTTQDVQPVSRIDATRYTLGERTVTRALKRRFADYVARDIAEKARFRV